MKIVNRSDFLSLPVGTLFSKYKPCVFGPLEIKGDNIGRNDFSAQQIADAVYASDSGEFADILFDAEENGSNFKMDLNCEGRDGLFDDDQLFAVWERDDVLSLIERLQRTIT